jgi:co-chaperonin GroES (HSP10)
VIRMRDDNVLLALEPIETRTKSGIVLPDFEYIDEGKHKGKTQRRNGDVRFARVVSVGKGHYPGCKKCGGCKTNLIPTQVKEGERVLVPALAGEDYSMDISAPRHFTGKGHEFKEFGGESGELRIVREGQILGVIEDD